ncbi:hypothetical protein BpHYR1_054181 [Brachionus plicatilis]|uniref:Uncharacterized protein n=1 Tax=Brachionus plicatilis TaxID=10195 RepID=A0A3M7P3R3_BRAPC|nr:hypothetical protein BpHYR1_054181 [Brachionus plicatilis]
MSIYARRLDENWKARNNGWISFLKFPKLFCHIVYWFFVPKMKNEAWCFERVFCTFQNYFHRVQFVHGN